MTTSFLSPRVRKFLRTQQILLSIGALICLTLWALRIPTSLILVLVNSVVIGNVLNVIMEYAGPYYDHLNPPWNWVVYVPLLGTVSLLGILLAAASLYYLLNDPGVTYRGLLRITAPFGMVVSMSVGLVWYGVARIQLRLQERNLQLENALAKESTVVRQQEQELVRARQIQQELLPKSIPQLRGI